MTAPVALLAILYAGGYLAQFIGNYMVWKLYRLRTAWKQVIIPMGMLVQSHPAVRPE